MSISGVTVIKNGVLLGYPFVESILSLLPLCDEMVICEGYSDDDTWYWLKRLQMKFPDKIRLFQDRWPEGLSGGQAIGAMQTMALKRCRGRWVYLLQADEIMPEENISYLQELCHPQYTLRRILGRKSPPAEEADSAPRPPAPKHRLSRHLIDLLAARIGDVAASAFVFNSYNVDFVQAGNQLHQLHHRFSYRWAIRLARNRPFLYTGSDGWQLQGSGCFPIGTARLPRPIIHVGYAFPVNRWRKDINHAHLYPDNILMQKAAHEAARHLQEHERSIPLAMSADQPNPLALPPLLVPLIGQSEYWVREELFSSASELGD